MAELIGSPLTYRSMTPDEAEAASKMVAEVFDQFIAPEYAPEGRAQFMRYIEPAELRARLNSRHFTLLAFVGDQIVGILEMRDYEHISLLFVAAAYHRQGIAGELWRRALALCRSHNPGLTRVTVNSSPFAVEVYRRLGFSPAGPRQVVHGIGFVPMVIEFA